jgi:hypothetical protein
MQQCSNAQYPPQGKYLLGDGGYNNILQPISILTPYRDTGNLTAAERRFNHQHSKGRMIIECAFGSMCQRWRSIFQRSLPVKLPKAVKMITACCIMHNICLATNDFIALPQNRNQNPVNAVNHVHQQNQIPANDLRNNLCAQLAAEPPLEEIN